jgi:inorganic triphosphatase YgiF
LTQATEIELKFLVPAAARAALAAEMTRGSSTLERRTLAAMYLDTPDRRLARAGIAWRLRREGRRWVQTLKAGGRNALERFEHEVLRPGASYDPLQHAGTRVGDKLLALLERARSEGLEVGVRYRTQVRRTARRVRTRGAVVEVAFDEGRLLAGDEHQRIREVEFELLTGSPVAMLAMAERWRRRFGLVYDPRSKAERGDRMAQGERFPPVRKAARPEYAADADALQAFSAVIDECLSQVTRNAIGLLEGDPARRVDHVHQLRVGIRRLRSALRSFEGMAPMLPADAIDRLRALFATLGQSRDSDVLDAGVVAELARVGAPPLALPAGEPGPDPAQAVRAPEVQAMFLSLIAWRAGLAEPAAPHAGVPSRTSATDGALASDAPTSGTRASEAGAGAIAAGVAAAADGQAPDPPGAAAARASVPEIDGAPPRDPAEFRRRVEKRLRKWHRRIVGDWKSFDALDEEALHGLRKRIKRQRYAVEFFAPVLDRRSVRRYLEPLAAIQERMGELNDLFVARGRYQALVAADPAAWFALGWLAARMAAHRTLAGTELGELARVSPPKAR